MAAPAGPFVLVLSTGLSAPRQQAYRMLTEPRALAQWWGPAGFTTTRIDSDLRVGGRYRIGMQPPDGPPFYLTGEFIELNAPSSLAYTFRWEDPDPDDQETIVRLSIDSLGETSRVALWHGHFTTEARLALHQSGWRESLERLREVVESGT